jgi:hypothetical protein
MGFTIKALEGFDELALLLVEAGDAEALQIYSAQAAG